VPVKMRGTITIAIILREESGFTHGQTIEVKLRTKAGNEYPKAVTLQ